MTEMEELRRDVAALRSRIVLTEAIGVHLIHQICSLRPDPLSAMNLILGDVHDTLVRSRESSPVIADRAIDQLASIEGTLTRLIKEAGL
jgi:hypothetical protein